MKFELIDSQNETLTTYPEYLDVEELVPEIGDPGGLAEEEEETRPIAIKLTFSLPDVGSMERVWLIPNVPTIPEVETETPAEGVVPPAPHS